MSRPELSVIFPRHNENQSFIEKTVNGIKSTIDVDSYEIIIVDDGSKVPLEDIEDVLIFQCPEERGVGSAFDVGVGIAQSDNLFLMGSDIRFLPNGWASKMIAEIDLFPEAIVCSTCIGLNENDMDMERRRGISRRNAATILMFHDKKSHPKKPPNFRNIIEAQWLPVHNGSQMSFEVPCILGAAYGVKRSWYNYMDGWWGHRSWGTLEPYISLKSWVFGGSCRTAPAVETGHIFKPHGPHGTKHHHLLYNKMLVATLLFPDDDAERLIGFFPNTATVKLAKEMFLENKDIPLKAKEYKEKIVYDIADYCNKFNIDLRRPPHG